MRRRASLQMWAAQRAGPKVPRERRREGSRENVTAAAAYHGPTPDQASALVASSLLTPAPEIDGTKMDCPGG